MKRSSYRGEHKGSTLKARGKIYTTRVINATLAFVLVVGLAPSMSFASDPAVTLEEPQPVIEQPAVDPEPAAEENTPAAEDPAPTTEEVVADDQTEVTEADAPVAEIGAKLGNTVASKKALANAPRMLAASALPVTFEVHKGTDVTGDKLDPTDGTYYYNDAVTVKVNIAGADSTTVSKVNVDGSENTFTGESTTLATLTKPGSNKSTEIKVYSPSSETDPTATITIVQDITDPELDAQTGYYKGDGKLAEVSADGIDYVNLSGTDDKVTLRVTASKVSDENESPLSEKSKIEFAWKKVDGGNEVGTKPAVISYKAGGNGSITSADFTADEFYQDNAIVYLEAKVTLEDVAGNKPVAKVYKLSSESGLLNKLDPKITLTKDENVGQKGDVYNGDVTVSVKDGSGSWDAIKSILKSDDTQVTVNGASQAGDNGTSLPNNDYSWKASNGSAEKEQAYNVKATYKTKNGATKEVSDSFTINTTKPTLSASINNSSEADYSKKTSDGVYMYGNGKNPVVTLKVDNASTVTADNLKVTLKEDGEPLSGVQWEKSGSEYTATLQNTGDAKQFEELTQYVASVDFTGNDIFGSELSSSVQKTEAFMIDTQAPIVTIAFSAAALTDPETDSSTIVTAIIDSVQKKTEGAKVTVTVDEKNFDKTDTTNNKVVLKQDGSEKKTLYFSGASSEGTKHELTIPYADLTEGNGWSLVVEAVDTATNKTIYTYADDKNTTVAGKELTNKSTFSVDTESVEFVSFKLYEDAGLTTEATSTNVAGQDYYSYAKLYGKLVVKDANFEPKSSSAVIKQGASSVATLTEGDWKKGATSGGKTEWYATYEFTEGVDYSVEVTANDIPKNDALKVNNLTHFTLDYAAPDIAVKVNQPKYTVDGSASDWYASANESGAVTVDVTVKDASLNTAADKSYIETTTSGGSPVKTPLAGSNGTYTATVSFAESEVGTTHSLKVVTEDNLGHTNTYEYGDAAVEAAAPSVGKKSASDSNNDPISGNKSFIVDLTAPSITVNIDQQLYKTVDGVDYYTSVDTTTKKLTAEITVVDANFNNNSTVSVVTPTNGGEWDKTWVQDPTNKDKYTSKVVYDSDSAVGKEYGLAVQAKDLIATSAASHVITYNYGDQQTASPEGVKGGLKTTTQKGETITGGGTKFALDTKAPDIDVVMTKARAGKSVNGIDYYTEAVEAEITLTDNNFDPTKVSDHGVIEITSPKDSGITPGNWEPAGDGKYKATVTFPDSKAAESYAFKVTARDYASHSTEYKYGDLDATGNVGGGNITTKATAEGDGFGAFGTSFVVDSILPSIAIVMGEEFVGNIPNTDYFGTVTNGKLTATVQVTDLNFAGKDGSGIPGYGPQDLITIEDANGKALTGVAAIPAVWTPKDADKGIYAADVTFPENAADEAYVLKVTGVADTISANFAATRNKVDYVYGNNSESISDAGGNLSTVDKKSTPLKGSSFVVDASKPEVKAVTLTNSSDTAKPVGEENGVDYWNDASLKIKVDVFDAHFDATNAENASLITATGKVVTAAADQKWTESATEPGLWSTEIEFAENDAFEDGKLVASDFALDMTDLVYSLNKSSDHKTSTSYKDFKDQGVAGESFVLDATDVSIESLEWSKSPVGTFEDIDYYAEEPTLTVKVKDNTFDADKSKSLINVEGATNTPEWKQDSSDSSMWEAEFTFGENRVDTLKDVATSTVSFTVVDKIYTLDETVTGHSQAYDYQKGGKVGGKADEGSHEAPEFVVDMTQPTVSVSFDQKLQGTYNGKDFFGTVDNGVLTATITVKDNNFDTNTKLYPVSPTNGSWNGQWDTEDNYTYTTEVTYTENVGTENDLVIELLADKLYTSAEDKSSLDNHKTSYHYNTDHAATAGDGKTAGTTFVIDLTAPALTQANETTGWSTKWDANAADTTVPYLFYNDRTGAGVAVTMSDANGIRTAAAEAPFSLSGPGADIFGSSTQTVALLQGANVADRDSKNAQMQTALVTLTDYAGNYSIWNISKNGTVFRVSTGSATAENATVDIKGGTSVHPTVMVLDQTAPYLSWVTAPTAGQYYKEAQSATLNAFEMNFDYLKRFAGPRGIATINRADNTAGAGAGVYRVITASEFSDAGGSNWRATLPFNDEGHYTVTASFEDIAGNPSNTVTINEFTLDWTAPVIQDIVFDNNDVRNGKYYKAGRTATITVIEHNWDASLFTITTNGSIGGWSDNGDTHTCTVSFTTDGTYNLSVSGADKAGNNAEPRQVDEFVVDLTAPTIDFSNVTGQTAYNDTIAPVINYHDEANFDSNGMTWTLTGSKHGGQTYGASQSSSGNDGTVSFADFPRQVEADDIYTLQAHLTDLAGNEADNSITFSVNRFGSNFIILDEKTFTENKGYLAEPVEIRVQEINVSGALSENHGVSVTHGLTTENLKMAATGTPSSQGFYIESGSDSAGWASYTYHIGSGNFNDDGNYHVVISSTDTATNLNNSASYYNPDKHAVADAEVSFILDTADPIIDGISVVDGRTYNSDTDRLTFTVTDNIGFDEVKVVVDGDTQTVEPEMGGLCTVDLPAKAFTPRDLQIVATDLAGRSAEATVLGFHWTDNFVELNLPLVIGGGIVLVAAIAFGIFYARRRKQQEQ